LVDDRGDGFVFERLVGHHVAPVAGRVADGDEDRHVTPGGLGERRLGPRPPVDRVVLVLEQIGRGGIGEPVHASTLSRDAARRLALGLVAGSAQLRGRASLELVVHPFSIAMPPSSGELTIRAWPRWCTPSLVLRPKRASSGGGGSRPPLYA